MFIQTAGGLYWLEWRIVLYLGQYRQMQHLLILKDLHIGQVISVIWKFWTLEFKFQLTEILKEQRQTGKKNYRFDRKYFYDSSELKYSALKNSNSS